jgi:putative membrane protein
MYVRIREQGMTESPYERFEQTDLILRDELAIDRTLLSNERTLLAYLRSAVALIITGVSIIHFADKTWFLVTGFACIPGSLLIAWIGLYRFRKMNKAISMVRNQMEKTKAIKSADPRDML